jgi:GNAT superfamily N-acetyltransferase
MQKITSRAATYADLPRLAAMNQRLIQDERSRNPMTLNQLEARLRAWLDTGDWHIDLIEIAPDEPLDASRPTPRHSRAGGNPRPIGYTVYQHRHDDYDPSQPIVYVRQFYIERDWRGRGWGRRAFALLARERFPAGSTITLEALASNPGGYRFWASLGFTDYCVTMKRDTMCIGADN